MNVRATEMADAQRAMRLLLKHGVVNERIVGESNFANLRRYLEPVRETLAESGGYQVTVHRRTIALNRRHDSFDSTPSLVRPDGRGFDRVRYALFVLALSALERLGQQTTLTELARRIRDSTTSMEDLTFDPDQFQSRLALGHAVRALENFGVMQLTDGSRESWESNDSTGDALYDIDRDACRALFPITVRRDDDQPRFLRQDPNDLGRDPMRRARKQRLMRALLERPVVYIADLDEPTRTYLKREAASVAQEIERLTGGTVERRAEGLALVDAGRRFAHTPFPVGGSASQAALLLAGELCKQSPDLPVLRAPHAQAASILLERRLMAALGHTSDSEMPSAGPELPFADDALLGELGNSLVRDLGPGLTVAHAESSTRFVEDAIQTLEVNDLVRRVTGGIVLMPMLARFREVTISAPSELTAQLNLGM